MIVWLSTDKDTPDSQSRNREIRDSDPSVFLPSERRNPPMQGATRSLIITPVGHAPCTSMLQSIHWQIRQPRSCKWRGTFEGLRCTTKNLRLYFCQRGVCQHTASVLPNGVWLKPLKQENNTRKTIKQHNQLKTQITKQNTYKLTHRQNKH